MKIKAKYLSYTVYIIGVSLKGIATCVYPINEKNSRIVFIRLNELTVIDTAYLTGKKAVKNGKKNDE